MERQFVFQHSLSVISDLETYTADELFTKHPRTDNVFLGHPTVFKTEPSIEGLQFGYQIIDPDLKLTEDIAHLEIITFPTAEYLFNIHKGPFREISDSYSIIETQLEEEGLNPIYHPILNFPLGIPQTLDNKTTIEIWTGTDANYSAEFRRSEQIQEALPRKRYNFYTW